MWTFYVMVMVLLHSCVCYQTKVRPYRQQFVTLGAAATSTSTPSTGNGIDPEATQRLLTQANAWCGLNGLMYSDGDKNWNMAPVALVPNAFSRECFEYAESVQPIINVLIDMISRDRDFLLANLLSVAGSDAFTKRLLDIYSSLPDAVVKESVHLGLHRSDYMIDYNPLTGIEQPLQVEMNTIASSFGCLSKKVGDFHRFMLARNADSGTLRTLLALTAPSIEFDPTLSDSQNEMEGIIQRIPENRSVRQLALALAMAHFLYGDKSAVVLFVVQPGERNVRVGN
jgi:glutathione synthase